MKRVISFPWYAALSMIAFLYVGCATEPDTTPPVLSDVSAPPVTDSTAIISWTTDEPTTGQVEYGTTSSYGLSLFDEKPTTAHSLELTGLDDGTTYHFRIRAVDDAGNETLSEDAVFTTLDATAPVLSQVTATPNGTVATITWTTDEPATGQVEYGVTTSYGQVSDLSEALLTDHSVQLVGLEDGTTVHFRVKSRDEAGNESVSEDATFTTRDETAPTVTGMETSAGQTTAAVQWETDEPTTGIVEYGLTPDYGQMASTEGAPGTAHRVELTGLEDGKTYYYRIRALDEAGNEIVTEIGIFDTIPIDRIAPSISDVHIVTTKDRAQVAWWTDDPTATGWVSYGITAYSDSSRAVIAGDGTGFAEIVGLSLGEGYRYRIAATDSVGNQEILKGTFGTADLVLDLENPEYEDYLTGKEQVFLGLLEEAEDASDPEILKARIGLALVWIAQMLVEMDKVAEEQAEFGSEVEVQLEEIGALIEENILALDFGSVRGLAQGLEALFEDPKYGELKARIERVREAFEGEIAEDLEHLQGSLENLGTILESHVEDAADQIDAVWEDYGDTDFELKFYVEGTDHHDFTISDANFDNLTAIVDRIEGGLHELEEGLSVIGEKYGSEGYQYTDQDRATLTQALDQISSGLDEIRAGLRMEPFAQLDISTAPVDELQRSVLEIQEMLDGKAYEIGEGKTIRPVAWLEQGPGDLGDLIVAFYASDHPEQFTFGGLFPQGLPQGVLDAVEPDLIIDPAAPRETIRARLDGRLAEFEEDLRSDPTDSDAHLGVALIKTYDLIDDHVDDLGGMMSYVERGDIAGLYENYDLEAYDRQTTLDSIRTHLNGARADEGLSFILILLDREASDTHDFEVHVGDEILPVCIGQVHLDLLEEVIRRAEHTTQLVRETVGNTLDALDDVFIIALDPNELDFSESETPNDFIDALLASNPAFLNLAPGGPDVIRGIGDDIRTALRRYDEDMEAIKSLVAAIVEREEDLGIDGASWNDAVSAADELLDTILEDFETPEATTTLGPITLNLSAWFDTPPDSLLYKIRDFLSEEEGTDKSLGGLFVGFSWGEEVKVEGVLEISVEPDPIPIAPVEGDYTSRVTAQETGGAAVDFTKATVVITYLDGTHIMLGTEDLTATQMTWRATTPEEGGPVVALLEQFWHFNAGESKEYELPLKIGTEMTAPEGFPGIYLPVAFVQAALLGGKSGFMIKLTYEATDANDHLLFGTFSLRIQIQT